MSNDEQIHGGKAALAKLAAEAKGLVDEGRAEEQQHQMELLEPISSEEALEAREQLGPNAGALAVLRHARENRKGRPAGARNRRTADTVAYLSQFGPDPLVAMMKILAEDEETMVARSQQVDPAKKQMSLGEARAMRIRCAETLAPYFHGKKPVAIDATIRGVMLVEEIGSFAGRGTLVEGVLGTLPPETWEDEA